MIGKTLGHYQITSQLGKGRMGEVFQAKDHKLGRDAAIKVLSEAFSIGKHSGVTCPCLFVYTCLLFIGLYFLLLGYGCFVSNDSSISAKLYDLKTGEVIQVFSGGGRVTYFAAFSPDGSKILTGWPGTPTLWDVGTGQKIKSLIKRDFCKPVPSTPQSMFMVSFSPDGTKAITANKDSGATIWNVESQTEWKTFFCNEFFPVTFVGFDRGGTQALIGFIQGAWWLNVPSGEVFRTVDTGGSQILALSPDRTRIISTKGVHDSLGGIMICSFATKARKATFSPDGRTVFTEASDGIREWDTTTCALKRMKNEERQSLYDLSPDGRLAVMGKWDEDLNLWDLKAWKMLRSFPGPVLGAAFSPDSKSILALGYGKTQGH